MTGSGDRACARSRLHPEKLFHAETCPPNYELTFEWFYKHASAIRAYLIKGSW